MSQGGYSIQFKCLLSYIILDNHPVFTALKLMHPNLTGRVCSLHRSICRYFLRATDPEERQRRTHLDLYPAINQRCQGAKKGDFTRRIRISHWYESNLYCGQLFRSRLMNWCIKYMFWCLYYGQSLITVRPLQSQSWL